MLKNMTGLLMSYLEERLPLLSICIQDHWGLNAGMAWYITTHHDKSRITTRITDNAIAGCEPAWEPKQIFHITHNCAPALHTVTSKHNTGICVCQERSAKEWEWPASVSMICKYLKCNLPFKSCYWRSFTVRMQVTQMAVSQGKEEK